MLRTRAPVSGVQALPVTPRLACAKPAASVHPEPGLFVVVLLANLLSQRPTKTNQLTFSKWFCFALYLSIRAVILLYQ